MDRIVKFKKKITENNLNENFNCIVINPETNFYLSSEEVENKLVYLMSVDKARFRSPIIPECKLLLEIEAIRSRGKVWRYKGIAIVNGKKKADAEWVATIMDRKK